LNLLARVTEALSSQGIAHALVGGMALAAHGLARATFDADVLVLAPVAVDEHVWERLRAAGATIKIRRGDPDDPFQAVIRVSAPASSPVDVLVGRFAWQHAVIARATPVSLPTVRIPLVGAADLVLLKIFAGGPQDLVDAQRLLTTPDRSKIVSEVDARIDALPESCRREWARLKSTAL
jgi:hypothetical protein